MKLHIKFYVVYFQDKTCPYLDVKLLSAVMRSRQIIQLGDFITA